MKLGIVNVPNKIQIMRVNKTIHDYPKLFHKGEMALGRGDKIRLRVVIVASGHGSLHRARLRPCYTEGKAVS